MAFNKIIRGVIRPHHTTDHPRTLVPKAQDDKDEHAQQFDMIHMSPHFPSQSRSHANCCLSFLLRGQYSQSIYYFTLRKLHTVNNIYINILLLESRRDTDILWIPSCPFTAVHSPSPCPCLVNKKHKKSTTRASPEFIRDCSQDWEVALFFVISENR